MCEGVRVAVDSAHVVFHTRGTTRQPLAAPGRGLRGWEVCSNHKDNEMQCMTANLISRVVAAHRARAPVRVVRCAHDWGRVAARHCGAVCVVRGGGMAAIVRDVADAELLDRGRWHTLRRGGSAWRLRVVGGPDDPEACAGGARVEVSVACL
ncbi:hypothetical protein TcBrA4_0020940 [Trypanosoma cruzi]|nr:hypothetical protein TcBrA4_0020940 [Trypanosoma cruzi]